MKQEKEEISLDFTKITRFFKKGKKGDEESADLKTVTAFIGKYGIIFLILIPILVSSFFRLYPVNLPATDDWAEDSVKRYLEQQIRQQIDLQYPNLPDANKAGLVNQELQVVMAEQGDQIQMQIDQTSAYFKSRMQDDEGNTYLLAIDSYYWYALARNYLSDPSTGFGDAKNEEGKNVFTLRDGRVDKPTTPLKFIPGFIVFLYKIAHVFENGVSLLRVTFMVPVILIGLSIIPAFFIAKMIAGNLAGFFAGMIIALNGALLARTPAGFSDSDGYNVFFPLFIVWTFLLAINAKNLKMTMIYSALTGLLFGLFSISWLGWGHLIVILGVTMVASIVYHAAVHHKEIMKQPNSSRDIKGIMTNGIALITVFLSSALFVSLFRGFHVFLSAIQGVIGFINLKEVGVTTLWPNVLTTVAEFNVLPLRDIVNQMGGIFIFITALAGISFSFFALSKQEIRFKITASILSLGWYIIIVMVLLNSRLSAVMLMILLAVPTAVMILFSIYYSKKRLSIEYAVLMLVWFVATLYSFVQGARFALLLVPSLAIGFGVALGVLYRVFPKYFESEFKIDPLISKGILIIAFSFLFFFPGNAFAQADRIAKNQIPSMNDAWFESLRGINDASEDAIITSWWDFGHWFYSISERRVTFDGADQGRRIHWVGKTLQSGDEDLVIGILRMLNCGQEEGFRVYNKNLNGLDAYDPAERRTPETIELMYTVMPIHDRNQAKQVLLDAGFTDAQAEESLEYTHCADLIDQFYIASDDMIGKSGVWGHFGTWDFTRAQIWQTISKNRSEEEGVRTLMEIYGYEDPVAAANTYHEIRTTKADHWVSPWPSYGGSRMSGCQEISSGMVSCNAGFRIGDTGTQRIVLESVIVNTDTLRSAEGVIGFYDRNNFRVGEGRGMLANIKLMTADGFETLSLDNTTLGFDIVLASDGAGYRSLIADPLLSDSVFTRLFFLEGHGLKHFKLHSYKQAVTGGQIYVYRVDWTPGMPNIYSGIIPAEEVLASHILVETKEEADEILALLAGGEDFTTLAKDRSICPSSEQGGMLGWFGTGAMVPEFESATFGLNVGELTSAPIKTQFGYHIIYVHDKRGGTESLTRPAEATGTFQV